MTISNSGSREAQLFVVPASGPEARAHFAKTIEQEVDPSRIFALLDESVREILNGRPLYAWAATSGARNRPFWDAMQPGDTILFYQSRSYTYRAKVVAKVDSPAIARELWGQTGDGGTWNLVYFLTPPVRVDTPIERLGDYLQETPYLGFVRIPSDKSGRIVSDYGSIDNFLDDRLQSVADKSAGYFIIRRNLDSPWDDSPTTYHFSKTVPNYRKLRAGSKLLLDRRSDDGPNVFAKATVGSIEERTGSDPTQYDARLENYEELSRQIEWSPTLRALLALEPGYNSQHSIRPISKALYDRILSEQDEKPAFSSLIIPNESFAESLYWDQQRADSLIKLFNRSRQLLLAGPPGTGKTFVATKLAEIATNSVAHHAFVQFHPSYAYEDFIEGIRPTLNAGGATHGLSYELHRGLLRQIAEEAIRQPTERFVLVVDEINRANLSKVFGELLFCLEYRGAEHTVQLPYSSSEFYLPENLWIIATMNTADKSIGLIDGAFRRRFKTVTLDPDYEALRRYLGASGQTELRERASTGLMLLNDQISGLLWRDRVIGHSYLMRPDLQEVGLQTVWTEDLEPLVEDYTYGLDVDLKVLQSAFLGAAI